MTQSEREGTPPPSRNNPIGFQQRHTDGSCDPMHRGQPPFLVRDAPPYGGESVLLEFWGGCRFQHPEGGF